MPNITNWTELAAISSAPTLSYVLMNNLDADTPDYIGIGDSWTSISASYGIRFTGVFDGNGHTISDIIQTTAGADNYAGLFGMLWGGGLVKNVGIINASITVNKSGHGAIAGGCWGSIENCHVDGGLILSTSGNSGGIAGVCLGTITNCHSSIGISTVSTAGTGGIVGFSNGTLTNCLAVGTVSTSANSGGVVGRNDGTVINCGWLNTSGPSYAIGDVGGSVTHETNTLSDFYDSTHNLYDNQIPYWDFTTPIWYEYTDNLPQFTAQGGAPIIVTSSPAIIGACF